MILTCSSKTASKNANETTHQNAFKKGSLQAKSVYFGLNLHNTVLKKNKSLSTMTAP